jgi:hypothetical protein
MHFQATTIIMHQVWREVKLAGRAHFFCLVAVQ